MTLLIGSRLCDSHVVSAIRARVDSESSPAPWGGVHRRERPWPRRARLISRSTTLTAFARNRSRASLMHPRWRSV